MIVDAALAAIEETTGKLALARTIGTGNSKIEKIILERDINRERGINRPVCGKVTIAA